MKLLVKYRYQAILIGTILIVIWPLSFFQFIPKWDNIDQYLPYRNLVSHFFLNGELPLWSPFQHLGETPYADLQTGCWYPITWLLLTMGEYTITSLHVEIVATFLIAGLGFFKLSKAILNHEKTSLILSLCYALSGFMVGSAQLLTFLIGIAWLPWVVFAFVRLFQTKQVKYALLGALFFSLSATGAAPQFTVILSYAILIATIAYFVREHADRMKIFKLTLIFGITTLVLLAPLLKSFIDFLPYLPRTGKLPYNDFYLANSFSVKEYISFIFPYTVIADTDVFNPTTDLTMRNGYFGIIGLIAFIFSFRNFKRYLKWFIIAFIFLILAMGGDTFVYKIVYYLPGFGSFRHATFYKVYFMLIALLLAGTIIKDLLNNHNNLKKSHLFFGLVGLFILLIINGVLINFEQLFKTISGLVTYNERIYSSFFVHTFINISALIFLLGVYLIGRLRISIFVSILIVCALDLFIQTQLTAPKTITNKFSYQETKLFFDSLPNTIQQPLNQPLKHFDGKTGLKSSPGFWRNLATLNKTVSYEGYNPTQFKRLDQAEKNEKLALEIENPIMFGNGTTLDAIEVGYNEFNVEVPLASSQASSVILNQNYHHLWKAKIGDTILPIEANNNLTMVVNIPPNNKGPIKFWFESPYLMLFFGLSLTTYFLVLIYSLRTLFLNRRDSR